ncbi:MAG: hypothetical protein BGO55_26870 [Sphingobacteriales bacterium 50-39]|nr:hypothetical protein [Sphingobacteriales bacterium]OJW56677.1 MAG: hypothetical protein BGO55_26870 [Sphingobacteriales bacterium 50-39]
MKNKLQYDDYIRRSILLNNEFGIKDIRDLEQLKSMSLIREEYPRIAELAKNKDVESIKNLQPSTVKTSEYIAIMQFADQGGEKYIVTTYDNDDLSQDPQVIDIFKM